VRHLCLQDRESPRPILKVKNDLRFPFASQNA
jgi:hypothetical protein